MRKIRRPSKAPTRCTVTFILEGDSDERLSQYMWFKALEKNTSLGVMMQATFQTETTTPTKADILSDFDGLLAADDLPAIADE